MSMSKKAPEKRKRSKPAQTTTEKAPFLTASVVRKQNNLTQEELSQAAAEHAAALILPGMSKRLSFKKLFEISGHLIHCGILQQNRCAVVNSIACTAANLGIKKEAVTEFFKTQMSDAPDCSDCSGCRDGKNMPIPEPELAFTVFTHEGSTQIH